MTLCLLMFVINSYALAQDPTTPPPDDALADPQSEVVDVTNEVEIQPGESDDEIRERLIRIFDASEWFVNREVKVDEGVVFLRGIVREETQRDQAANLARRTAGVVAVINRLTVLEPSPWDFTPAWREMRRLLRETVQSLPFIAIALLLMVLTWFAAIRSTTISRRYLRKRVTNGLLRDVVARAIAIPVFLIGLYVILRVSGLTQIAATVIGGTGLIGLVIGIAFRDIAENFLASILISMQRPFALGDNVNIAGSEGIVQSVTSRGTLLMAYDGNHIQIPNSQVYKSVIKNYTANPHVRAEFRVGIAYEDNIEHAQEVILGVCSDHPAVLDEPQPLILVDRLGDSTVNLLIFFWLDAKQHSLLKVRSAVIRLTKIAIQEAGMSMPDASREIIFPKGVPVTIAKSGSMTNPDLQNDSYPATSYPKSQCNQAEGDLRSDHEQLAEQAKQSRTPEQGENLLED